VPQSSQNESISERDEIFEKNYQVALSEYEELRRKLEGKLPSQGASKKKVEPDSGE
jgi:hypothetical protein